MNILIFIWFFTLSDTPIQSQKIDKLTLVNNYLLDIKELINHIPKTKKAKLAKFDHLLKQGSAQKRMLEEELKKTKNAAEHQGIIRQFNFVLQAVILVKTDIKNNIVSTEDIDYLNQNIPILIRKIKRLNTTNTSSGKNLSSIKRFHSTNK